MTGDSENELEGAGGTPAPTPAEPKAADEQFHRPRAFRNWASAKEEEKEPSVLSRIGQRISGMFSKSKGGGEADAEPMELDAAEAELESAPAPVELEAESVDLEAAPARTEQEVQWIVSETPVELESEAAEPAPLIEPQFAPAPEPAIDSEPVVMWEPDAPSQPEIASEFEILSDSETAPPAPPPDTPEAARPKRPSLIARLFGRTSRPIQEPPAEVVSFEQPVLELASDETSTVERPLEETPGEEMPGEGVLGEGVLGEDVLGLDVRREEVAFEEPVVEEPVVRPGFFARLFGRKPKLAVEEHQFDEPMLDEAIAETPIAEEPVAEESFAEASFGEAPVAEESVAEESFAQELVAEEPPAHAIMDASIEDEEVVNTNEYPVEAAPEATPDETFTSVDEALPLDEESISADLLEPVDSAPVATPEPGFFARLFARKSKPVARPSLEIEVHEDRIEAAVHALDEVSGESFSSAVADRESSQETFASVEEALPSVDEALPLDEALPSVDAELPEPEGATRPIDVAAVLAQDATRPIDVAAIIAQDDQRFAPPAAQESRSTLEIEPFDPFATDRDSRDTVETAEDSRSTVEMQQDARSTVEVAQDLSDTLEIDEKTDEFAVPTLDAAGPTGDVDEGPDTLEVSKQSWIARLLGFRKKEGDKAAATAAVVEGKPNFLFSKFRAFYNEIIRFKHQKTEFTAGFSTAIVTDYTADLSPDSSAEIQSKALMQMLELQAAEAAWMGGEAKARYPDAQYAMAVMADEIFTHIEWEGKEAWPKHLLEVKLYKTHSADMELFNRIDKLLKEQPNSPVARDLARVYLLVIAAGFQGKYRPFGLTRALAEYRQRLYEYIHNDDPLMLYAPERKIFPEAESRTLEGHAVSRFTAAQRWAAILVFLLVGYTVMAHFAWNRVAADLKDVTARIRTAGATTGTGSSAPSTTTSNTTGAR